MQYFDISIAANAARQINAPGRFLRYYSGSAGGADESILVRVGGLSGAGGVILKPGQSLKLPAAVDSWYLSNFANASTITGRVVIGMAVLDDDRVTGEVSVINGEVQRVMGGKCFVGLATQAASAGNFSHGQLWNPAGSGKNLILTKITPMVSPAAGIAVQRHNAALTTLIGNGYNKLLGNAVSTAELRSQLNAAQIGTNFANFGLGTATDSKEVPFSEPIVIPPGFGVIVVPGVVNIAVWPNYQWTEEAA